jgi:hypothetical protein
MNYIYFIIIFALFQDVLSINNSKQFNTIEKLGLRLIIFKRKTYPKLISYANNLKEKYDNLYDKFILIYTESMIKYENMSYEDKQIIEFIMSSLF